MTRPGLLLTLTALLCSCAPPKGPPVFGAVKLEPTGASFAVQKDGSNLLAPFSAGSGVTAPVAVRKTNARVEAQYGAFKFAESPGDWTTSTQFTWDDVGQTKATGTYRGADKSPVVTVEASSPAPGELALTYAAVDPAMNRLSLTFACDVVEHFAGFGAQADGIDHRGHTVAVWTSEPGIGKRMQDDEYPELWFLEGTRHASSYPLPTFLSSKGHQVVVETNARSVFEVCSKTPDALRIEVWAQRFTLWLFVGDGDTHPLTQATGRVLGRPVRPPPIAFAPWNDAIFGAAEVRRVARVLRDNDVPSSVLWTEDFRGGRDEGTGYRLVEDWDLDRTLYPDAEGLSRELAEAGFAWHAYFNTFLVDGEPVTDVARRDGHFVKKADGTAATFQGVTFKPTGLADLSRPETRAWVKSYLRQALDQGFSGWMADFGEWLPTDVVLADGTSGLDAHNRYPHDWAAVNAEVLAERRDGVQRLFFVRSGWLKTNELAPVVWAGDQRTSFLPDDGLPTVVSLGLGLGLAGVSTFGHDIAGYQSNSATNPPSTKELFFRWTTLGALSPVMRTHHGIDARSNWRFDKDTETLAHYRRWAKFHLQLFPYLDGASVDAEERGLPLMRALPLAYPTDRAAWTTSDVYLLGPSLLVAPVLTQGAVSRTLHLPPGEWLALAGGGRVTGPTELTTSCPVTEIPVYFKAGAVVPRLPEQVDTLLPAAPPAVDWDDVATERLVWLAPGANGRFSERDGTTYELTRAAEVTTFRENGQGLAACTSPTQRSCLDRSTSRLRVRLSGQTVEFPGHRFTASGPAKRITVELLSEP